MAGTQKPYSPVRLGASETGVKRKIIVIGAAATVVLIIAVLMLSFGKSDPPPPPPPGCQSDADCSDGRFCAAGGCIVLMSSEHRGLWKDAVQAQSTPGNTWRAEKEVGALLGAETLCPVQNAAVPVPRTDRMVTIASARVMEIAQDEIRIHLHQQVKGEVWVDVLHFDLTDNPPSEASAFCGTSNVSGIRTFSGTKAPAVDVLLKTAAPAATPIAAGISYLSAAPQPNGEGKSVLPVPLKVPRMPGTAEHTMVAFPLGSDIFSVSGPKPARQKLINGFILYDFVHSNTPSTAVFTYKINDPPKKPMNVSSEPLKLRQ